MLGTRKVYPSSAINASCLLSLGDGPLATAESSQEHTASTSSQIESPQAPREVLLAAIGDSIEVYDVHSARVDGAGSTGSSSLSFTFASCGHRFLVGDAVLAMAPLPHQLFLVWTRTLELLLVRYQANLPPPPHWEEDLRRAGGEGLWQPSWRHWLLCGRVSLAAATAPASRAVRLSPPLERPTFFVNHSQEQQTSVTAHLFEGHTTLLNVSWGSGSGLTPERCDCCWGLRASSVPAALFSGPLNPTTRASSSSEMYLPPRPERNPADERGLRTVTPGIVPSADSPLAEPFYDLIDEDLLTVLPVSELMARKGKLATASEEADQQFRRRDGAAGGDSPDAEWEPPRLSVEHRSRQPWPMASPVPRVMWTVELCGSADGGRWGLWCGAFSTTDGGECPYAATAHPYRVQCYPTASGQYRLAVFGAAAAAAAGGGAVRECVSHLDVSPANFCAFSRPRTASKGAVPGPKRVVEALSVLPPEVAGGSEAGSTLWLLLADGSLATARCPVHTASEDASEAEAGGFVLLEKEPALITGLPESFQPSRFLPLGAASFADYQLNATRRFALLVDDICDVYVVDLHARRVVGGLVGDGAISSACAGPAGTKEVFIAHAKGVVRRLTPSVPLPLCFCTPLPFSGTEEEVRITRSIIPIHHSSSSDSEENDLLVVYQEDGAELVSKVRYGGTTLCALSVELPGGKGCLLRCTTTSVVLNTLSASEEVSSVALPSSATHAAATMDSANAEALVAAVLADGRLCLVSCAMDKADVSLRVVFTSPGPVVHGAARPTPPVSACGLACVPPSAATADAEGGEGGQRCLSVPVAFWGGLIRVLFLVRTASLVREWTLDATMSDLTNPEGTRRDLKGQLHGCALSPAPTAMQIVHSPSVGPFAVFAVRSSSDTVTVLSVSHCRGAEEQEEFRKCAEWSSLLVTARTHPVSSVDEEIAPTAAAIGPAFLVTEAGKPPVDQKGALGGGRSCVLLLKDRFISLLFFSVHRFQADRASDNVEVALPAAQTPALVAIEEMLQMHVAGASKGLVWQAGCATVDVSASGTLAHARIALDLLSREQCRAGAALAAYHVTVPEAVASFQATSLFNPPLQQVAERQASAERQRGYEAMDMELVVRTPPSYEVAASLATLAAELAARPGAFLSHMAYSPLSDTLVVAVDGASAVEPHSSRLVAVTGQSLRVAGRLETLDREVLCMQSVPFSPSVAATDTVVPQDLLLVGTGGLGGTAGAALLVALPQPLRIIATVVLSNDSVDGVNDIAIHCSRDRSWWKHVGEEALEDREDTEIIVAACCGKSIHVFRLAGVTLNPIATFTAPVYCFAVSLCLPYVAVGCGAGGQLWLRLQGDHKTASKPAKESEAPEVATDDAEDLPPLHGYPRQPMRLYPVATVPSVNAPAVSQAGYRGSQVVQADLDGSVVWMEVDLGGARVPASAPTTTWLVGTNEAACDVYMRSAVRLPSPPTMICVLTIDGVSGDGHAALWRRRRRVQLHAGVGLTLRNPSGDSSGRGPVRVLLPCQDGSLYTAQELPGVFAVDLARLEQAYTDRLTEFLAPAKAAASCAYGRPTNVCATAEKHHGEKRSRGVQLTCYGVPYRTSVALRNSDRTLPRQGVLAVDMLEQIFRLRDAGCGTAAPRTVDDRRYSITAEMERLLWELHGTDKTMSDCQEACAAW